MDLVKENDIVLKTRIDTFKGSISDINHYFDQMWKIMLDHNGMGLAAPQVGLPIRFFLMRKDETYEVFINPEILETSTDMLFETEGCLSFPELYLKIYRPKYTKVRYINKDGKNSRRYFRRIECKMLYS
jgi:peptide deformylase